MDAAARAEAHDAAGNGGTGVVTFSKELYNRPVQGFPFVFVPFADVYSHQHSLAFEPVHLSSFGGNYLKLDGMATE
jgi:hypothetical protein